MLRGKKLNADIVVCILCENVHAAVFNAVEADGISTDKTQLRLTIRTALFVCNYSI